MTGRERMAVFGVLLWLSGCAATPETGGSAVPRDPDRASVLARRGDLDWQAGREDAAIDAWQQAVALNPQDAVAVNNLALALAERHRYAEAARLLDDGIRHSPGVPDLHYNLAVLCELYLLQLDCALVHYRAYLDLTGDDAPDVSGWVADLERRLAP